MKITNFCFVQKSGYRRWGVGGAVIALLAWAGMAAGAADDDAMVAQFHRWAIQHAAAPSAQAQKQVVSEGVALAKARQAVMKRLVQQDPAKALQLVESSAVRKSLPANVAQYVEQRVSGLATIRVIHDGAAKASASADGLAREVEINGQTYPALVYGQRLSWQDFIGVPVHGIVVDGVLAVAESPVRVLAADEVPAAARQAGKIAADIGGEIKLFATHDEMINAERKLMFPTGVPLPNERQKQAALRTQKIVRVHPNELAWQRINERRLQQGLPALSKEELGVRPMGEEIEVGDGPVRADAGVAPKLSGSTDNSTLTSFPPIGNQASQGCCASFSTTYYQMTHMTAMVNGWNVSTGDTSRIFSPKWTYNMVNGGGDNGSQVYDPLSVGQTLGLATWKEFPYTGSAGDVLPWCTSSNVWHDAIYRRMNGYYTIDQVSSTNGLNTLKALLDDGYVVTFATYPPAPYTGWVEGVVGKDSSDLSTSNLVGQVICKYVQATSDGHAMTVVGYNDSIWCDLNGNSKVDPGEKGALKIANQWGTSGWSCNNGFIWLAYDALSQNSAVAGYHPATKVNGFWSDCVYVTTAQTNYIPKMLAKFTVNTADRGALWMQVGKDATTVTAAPSITWSGYGLWFSGGAYGFTGKTNAVDGTFWLDMTDLNPDPCQLERYFVGMYSDDSASLKSYTLVDNINSNSVTVTPAQNPVSFNPGTGIVLSNSYGTAWGFIDQRFALTAGFSASPTNGPVALAVTFTDTSAGPITNRFWQFGDGLTSNTTATSVAHTYNSVGTNTVQLTVSSAAGNVTFVRSNYITVAGSFSIWPSNVTCTAATTNGTVTVNATAGCTWSATSNAGWLTITAGASGVGNGTVGYTVADNTGDCVSRSGTMTIAGMTFTVNQAAGSGAHSLSPNNIAMPLSGGSTNLTVFANCYWTATNSVSWITMTGPTSGSGTGVVSFTVADNSSYCTSRTGTFTVAGLTCKVTQPTGNGSFSLTPAGATIGVTATNGSVTVAPSGPCAWTASSSASSWLKITSSSSGTGTGIVNYSVSDNSSNCAPRSGQLTIAGLAFTVNQSAGTGAFLIVPSSAAVAASGSNAIVTVAAGSGCPWTAASGASWLTITSGSSGTGSGAVSYAVADNTSNCVSRSGALTIAGKTFTVTQASGAGAYAISPTNATVGADVTIGSVTVTTTGSSCPWTATSGTSWLIITSGTSGSGPGTVAYAVDSNNSNCVARTGTLTIAGKVFTLTQPAGAGSLSVVPTNMTVSAGASSGNVVVTAGNGCAWTATSGTSWLTITSGGSGTGNGMIVFAAAANTNSCSPRSGALTVAGQTITVSQNAGSGIFTISPTGINAVVGGTNGLITVISTGPAGCPCTATNNVNWITITGQTNTGTGTDTVSYAVAPNTGNCSSRNGTLTIGGKNFAISQAAGTGGYSITPTNLVATVDATNGVIAVGAGVGCGWTATRNVSWLTVTAGTSGSGTGLVSYTVQSNTNNCASRVGTITIAGQVFTVTQPTGLGSWVVAPTSVSVVSAGATAGSVTVTAGAGCPWTAAANDNWIKVTAGTNMVGSGSVNYTVQSNASNCLARTGTMTIAGQVVTINQAAGAGAYTLTTTSASVGSDTSTGSVAVATTASCSWTATSSANWLTIVGSSSGTGSGTVSYAVQANTTNCTARTASLTIAGKSFVVNQSAGVGSYAIAPTSATLGAIATNRTVAVTATSTCGWTVSNAVSWISITAGASGTGNGSVTYHAQPNTTTNARTGHLSIAKQDFAVTQAGNVAPIVNIAAVAPISWPAATANLSATVIDDGAPYGQLTVQWSKASGPGNVVFGNTNAVNTTATVTTNGTYILRLAVSDGAAVTTQSVAVVVNPISHPAPTAARPGELPTLGGLPIVPVGEAINFTAEGAGLTCAWNFGDGSTSADCNPSHVFTNCGPHTVTVSLSDGTVITVSNRTIVAACDLAIRDLKLDLNFAKQTAACVANASLLLAPTFNVTNQTLILDVAGAQTTFILNSHGRGISSQGVCRLVYRKATGAWHLTAYLVGDATWLAAWAEAGLLNNTVRVPGNLVAVPVRLLVDTDAATATTNLHFTATGGQAGQAR